jgi:hypothetical protein
LENESEFWGYERGHHDLGEAAGRSIVLEGETVMRRLPDESDRRPIGKSWDIVIIDPSRIRYMEVIYVNRAGEVRGAATDEHPEGALRDFSAEPIQLQSSTS